MNNRERSRRHKAIKTALKRSAFIAESGRTKLLARLGREHRPYYSQVVAVNITAIARLPNYWQIANWIASHNRPNQATMNPLRYGEVPPPWLILPWTRRLIYGDK